MRPTNAAIIFILLSLVSCRPNSSASLHSNAAPESKITAGQNQLRVNLNTATREELMALPGIGEQLARRIIDYREKRGGLRRPEEIIIIEGFSERKYRALARLVCVE